VEISFGRVEIPFDLQEMRFVRLTNDFAAVPPVIVLEKIFFV
jgi:hypothetical protein